MNLEQMFIASFDDESLQSKFYFELLISPLYVLAKSEHFDGVLEEGNPLHLMTLKHENVSYVPIFLSKESMETFLATKSVPSLIVNGGDLLETIKHRNVIINAGQEKNIILYANEIRHILAQGKN